MSINWDLYAKRIKLDGNTIRDRQINYIQSSILNDFENSPSYFEITINNNSTTTKVHIVEDSNMTNEKNDYVKVIIMKPNDILKKGDVIAWNNEKWLCTAVELYGGIYYRGKIVQSNHPLKFYQNKTLRTLPCFITSGSVNYLELKESKYFITSDGRYLCICPDLGYIKKSDTHLRFLLNGAAYKVNGIDNVTNSNGVNGLILMELADDVITDDDNLDEGIANWGSNQSVSEIQILNGSYAELSYQNATLQLQVQCKFNGVIVENPEVIYSSSDEYVAVVNSQGLIQCKGTGETIVTAIFNNISTTIKIKGDMVVDNNYSIQFINPVSSIKLGKTVNYQVCVLNNGIEVNKPIVFNLRNEDGSSNVYATIESIVDKTITLKATSNTNYVGKYVLLNCCLAENAMVNTDVRIKIASLV